MIQRIVLVAAAALLLSGCVGLRDRVSDYICNNPVKVELGARAALEAAAEIKDPVARAAAIQAANALLEAVAACPPKVAPPG